MTFAAGDVPTAAQLNSIFAISTAIKSADETVSASTSFQDDNHLSLALSASSVYTLEMVFAYNASAAGDLKTIFTGPAGMSGALFAWSSAASTAASASLTPTTQLNWDGTAADAMAQLRGRLTTAGTAGTLLLRWAQVAASGSSIIRAGSFLRLTKIS